jgi:hypothetical protein
MRVKPIRLAALALLVTSALMAARPVGAAGGLPAIGTDPASIDLRTVSGSAPSGGGWAVPLRAEKPAWLSPSLEQQVLAANGMPVAAPLDAPLPGEIGIRPGSWEISPYGCTMNFIFTKSGSLGIGTAGHCVDRVGQHVILLTLAPGGSNPVLVDVGSVAARHENGIGDDFALISINPVLYPWVDATTALVAGPCGQFTGSGPQTLWHYGHGLAIGTGGTPRGGVALTWKADSYGWDGLAIFGDSGSPVRVTDLKAAGNLTHLVVDSQWLPSFIAGTRIGRMLQIASGWSLKNSAVCL